MQIFQQRNIPLVSAMVLAAFVAAVTTAPAYARGIGAVLGFVAWAFTLLVALAEQRRLYGYLKRHHQDKWAEITSGPFWGPGGRNSARGLRFVFGETEPHEDTRLEEMKRQLRRSIVWVPVALAMFIVLMIAGGVIGYGASRAP